MTFETFDQSDEETWPDQKKDKDNDNRLESTFKDRSYRLVTFETFVQSDEETWPDQKKDKDYDKYRDKDNDKDKYI